MDCVRCGTEVRNSRKPSIHNACAQELEDFNDNIILIVFPEIFSGKRLNFAQGLAMECVYCYRLAITNDLWLDLPDELRLEIRAYDTRFSDLQLCNQCRLGNLSRSTNKNRRRRPSGK